MRLADVGEVMSWQAGKLKYIGEPSPYVVPDVERDTTLQIVIVDERVGSTRYTGTVLESALDDWLTSLEQASPTIEVVRVNDETVLLRSRAGE